MSWLVVFASSFFPLVLLFILHAVNWMQTDAGSRPSLLRLKRHDGKRPSVRGSRLQQ